MRGLFYRRPWTAALVLGTYWLCLTASVAAPQNPDLEPYAPPVVRATQVASEPIRCLGTVFYAQAHRLSTDGWPSLALALDVTRADRCAGAFGRPVGRLHGFFVLTREKLAVRTHLRASHQGYWMRLCQTVRPDCLDVNAVVRWRVPAGHR
jgi:hypothetical protein